MTRLKPEEIEVRGYWIDIGSAVAPDSGWERIAAELCRVRGQKILPSAADPALLEEFGLVGMQNAVTFEQFLRRAPAEVVGVLLQGSRKGRCVYILSVAREPPQECSPQLPPNCPARRTKFSVLLLSSLFPRT